MNLRRRGDGCQRVYERYIYWIFAKNTVSSEVFSTFTTLGEKEIQEYFRTTRGEVRTQVGILGQVVRCQLFKRDVKSQYWVKSVRLVTSRQLAWSNLLGIRGGSTRVRYFSDIRLGLMLLALEEPKKAVVWAVRLGVSPVESEITKSVKIEGRYINKILG